MRVYDRELVSVPVPAFLRDGTLMQFPGIGWFRYVGQSGAQDGYWAVIDNPDIEPFWGNPVLRWTPLKKGERVQITGGEHFLNWLGTAQGEMMDGAEQIIVDGKDSPWSFSPKYIARVNDLTDEHLEATVQGTFSNMAEPIKMGPGHIMRAMPDTDYEHELAAGAFTHNIMLAIDTGFMDLPETNAIQYIFGVGIKGWEGMLQKWVQLFLKKQADYGNGSDDLGLEGQYAELHRKFTKLRRAMWEGAELKNEPLREVLMDLVGHCFLAMMYDENPQFVHFPKGGKK